MDYILSLIVVVGIYIILSQSFNLVIGVAGLFSMGHAAFYGIGAYTAALLAVKLGLGFLPAMVAGVAVAALFSLLLAAVSFRVRDDYLAITSLGFQVIISNILVNWEGVTGGPTGIPGIPRPVLFGFTIQTVGAFAILAILFAILVTWIIHRLVTAPFGRLLEAMRDEETALEACGVNTRQLKVTVFVIAGALAAIAGSLYARYITYISPDAFTIHQSIGILTMVIIGGGGHYLGPIVGVLVAVILPELLTFLHLPSTLVFALRPLLYGGLVVMFMMMRPQGLIGGLAWRPQPAAQPHKAGRAEPADGKGRADRVVVQVVPASTVSDALVTNDAILTLSNVSKSFGGLKSVDQLSLALAPGVITGLVGPNGAGKTTAFNLITGVLQPDQGSVFFKGRAITGMQPYEIARLGIGRTFQDVKLFPRMSVLENVMTGSRNAIGENVVGALFRRGSSDVVDGHHREAAIAALEYVGLADQCRRPAGSLAYGEQKLVALARTLVAEPQLVLLDEPAAGLDRSSLERLLELVSGLTAGGRTVLLVEHNLDVVRRLSQHLFFLDQGALVASGDPDGIFRRADLADRYFGTAGTAFV